MSPIKIQFSYNGILKNNHGGAASDLINRLAELAFENRRNYDVSYTQAIKEILIPEHKAKIVDSLIAANNFMEFVSGDFAFEIKQEHPHADVFTYSWELQYTLNSKNHTCVEVHPDKTIVCFQDEKKEIEFIQSHHFKIRVLEN